MWMKKKELHVLYIITKLELGGAQKVCLSLFNGLSSQGHRSFLISGTDGTLTNQVSEEKNIILLSSFVREVGWQSFITEWRAFKELVRKIKQLKKEFPDLIVHTHSTKAGILGRWAAWWCGIEKRIHTVHGFAFHEYQTWLKWVCIYAVEFITSFITTHYVCVSSHDVKTGIRLFPRFTQKHSIIRAAVDTKQFYLPAQKNKFERSTNTFVFGTISCFKEQKNLFDLLHAFKDAYAKNNTIRLEIIGDGILRPALEEWIKHHELTQVITLHGWQSEVAPIMIDWHAFVLSSLWEGLPCAVVEARLLKLPVLSYNTGGIHDIIFSGENGFLYKQKQWHQLAHGMLTLAQNNQLYKKLASYHDDLRSFEQSYMIQQHLTLYRDF
ncbi:MAG: putative glycosyltransferase EpsF [Candidatus Dependentiae bacterium ADurb.Bin331]|nr:MAG: putative glycosyltransferase EpsF [Candidatus Dependentiae bacterium ADurb.Bin331]